MRVLVVDDEPQIRRAVAVGLAASGFTVIPAATGEEGLAMAALHAPDIVILDLAMPGLDGFQVCRQLREWSRVPVIVLSVREDEQDKIRALDLGADDYLTKPFGLGELVARIRAVLRRSGEGAEEAPLILDRLRIDFARRVVLVDGQEIHLTPTEFLLLKYLTANRDRVVTHRYLLAKVWGTESVDDLHTLRVHVANLRNKIEPDPSRPQYIQTEPRIGYRFRSGTDAGPGPEP